jgi:hypothetical protein
MTLRRELRTEFSSKQGRKSRHNLLDDKARKQSDIIGFYKDLHKGLYETQRDQFKIALVPDFLELKNFGVKIAVDVLDILYVTNRR